MHSFLPIIVYLYLVCFTNIIDMSKNDKTSNNTNTSKKKKIEQKENNPNQLNNNTSSNTSNRITDQENEKNKDDYINDSQISDNIESEDKVVVTADQVRNLVAEELKERNRPEVASSFIGEPTTNNSISNKPSVDDREPMLDNIAANKNRLRFDHGKVHKDERAA